MLLRKVHVSYTLKVEAVFSSEAFLPLPSVVFYRSVWNVTLSCPEDRGDTALQGLGTRAPEEPVVALAIRDVCFRSCRDCPANVTDCFRTQCITADGYERGIVAVNNQLPGPSVQVQGHNCVQWVLCLIVVPLPQGRNPFAVQLNNNNRK
jgi:hypothetical protein